MSGRSPCSPARRCRRGRPRPVLVSSGGGDDFDPFAAADEGNKVPPGSMNSPFLNSPVVAQEAQAIFEQFRQLSALQPKFSRFDTEGKRMFIEQMEDMCQKLKVFTTRYKLASDDQYAQEMIRRLNDQLSQVGMTIDSMYDGLVTTTSGMKDLLEQEEKLGADVYSTGNPYFKDGSHAGPGMQEMPDFAKMMEDPEAAELLSDPEVLKIMQRCMANPEEFVKEADNNPKIRKVVEIFLRNMGDNPFQP